MKKFLLFVVLLAGIVAAAMGSFTLPSNYAPPLDGQVVSVATGTVLNGVKAALNDTAGTMILKSGDQYLFVWQYPGIGSGFWGINMSTAKAIDLVGIFKTTGNLANAKTVSDLITSLKSDGWVAVSGGSVSPLLVGIINAGRIASSAGATLGLFMVVPMGSQGNFLDWYHRYDIQS